MKREDYLLRTDQQVASYVTRYARFVKAYRTAYRDWIQTLPYFEWVPLQLKPGQEEAIIGLICVLHLDGDVSISFRSDMQAIRRER